MERVIRKQLVNFITETGGYENSQHGSRAGRSTTTQLIQQYMCVLDTLAEGHNQEIVYLDFSKAFDKVDHQTLLQKVAKLGVQGELLSWVRAFLEGREQRVRIGCKLSEPVWVRSGVPQGSVMGPILFLIYISDLGHDSNIDLLLKYVDDTKAFGIIKNEEDVALFQEKLQILYDWTENNSMRWNEVKFNLLRLGPNTACNNEIKSNTLLFTPNHENIITEAESVKDLGVMFDKELSFKLQRQNAINKTLKKSGWVLRTFRNRSVEFLRQLWKTIIIPHRDYCSILWSPVSQAGDKMSQEGPQRSFTKKAWGLYGHNYWDRLSVFKLYSIERRVERYKVLYLYKMINGLVPDIGLKYPDNSITRNRDTLLPITLTATTEAIKTKLRDSLLYNGVRIFNSIPLTIRNIQNDYCEFKKQLDLYLSKIPDQPATKDLTPEAKDIYGDPSNSILDWPRSIDLTSIYPDDSAEDLVF